ncbi:MAG: DUF1707 SHOCT-like domain-containing protein [Mycobacteriaceae bacterium]|uniref:DUF1707 SHOCT-like domain-containing protein n=1 Tax=Corynebacterium sp. TaxID=1720 RepID=UPI003F9CA75D
MSPDPDQSGRPDPSHRTVRIGDSERDNALSILAVHFADGRLSLTEYDERCRDAAAALTRDELDVLFTDLPVLPNQQAGAAGAPGSDLTVYSAGEIAEQHRRGSRPRAGIMGLATIGAFGAGLVFDAPAVLLIIPVVFILLYVIKIGPESWHTPSPEALERSRVRKQRREHQLELEERAHTQQLELEDRKAQRKLKQSEMGTEAMDLAQRAMKGATGMFKGRGRGGRGTGQ